MADTEDTPDDVTEDVTPVEAAHVPSYNQTTGAFE